MAVSAVAGVDSAISSISYSDRQLPEEPSVADISPERRRVRSQVRRRALAGRPSLGRQIFCPFGKGDVSSEEFCGKLQAMCRSGQAIPKERDGRLRIVFLVSPKALGTQALALRLMELLAQRGHECCCCRSGTFHWVEKIQPDFAISMLPVFDPPANVPSAQFWPLNISEKNGRFQRALRYDNIFYGTANIRKLQRMAARDGRKIRGLPLTISCKKTEFYGGPKERLVYYFPLWGARRKEYLAPLYEKLDSTGYFEVYGVAPKLKSCRGVVKDPNELLRLTKEGGVSLILHGADHLRNGTLSSRIFEAAAASTVVICDRHPFVVKHFGDSVLYIDQNGSPDELFRQIDGHMQWIRSHPREAVELARRSHAIFIEKFPLEREVEKIETFIREVLGKS
ncbi:MAG: hypothetical protein LBB14_00260 [Puniceicoccales bacterium]|jgi:hypothetical protein|nr:hypothetical protein [Puniceicoccales bacterium]